MQLPVGGTVGTPWSHWSLARSQALVCGESNLAVEGGTARAGA